jgi:hypothetical protein
LHPIEELRIPLLQRRTARRAIGKRMLNQRVECYKREWFLNDPGEMKMRDALGIIPKSQATHEYQRQLRRDPLDGVRGINPIDVRHVDIEDRTP